MASPRAGWSIRPQWYHPYPPGCLLPALLLLLACGAPVAWLCRRDGRPLSRGRAGVGVGLLFLLTFGLQVTLDWGAGPAGWVRNTVSATWSTVSNGYFYAATRITGVGEFVRTYHAHMTADLEKVATHPPGAVLAYWLPLQVLQAVPSAGSALNAFVDRAIDGRWADAYREVTKPPNVPREMSVEMMVPALFAALWIGALGAGVVVPVYLLGAAGGSRRTGVLAALLAALAPNALFYALTLDVALMTLAAWALLGVVWAMDGRRWAAFAAGAGTGVCLLTSLSASGPAALCVAYALACAARQPARRRDAALVVLLFGAGALVVVGAATLSGLHTAEVVRNCLHAHRTGTAGTVLRKYTPWVWLNLLDYALLLGIPFAAVAAEGLVTRSLSSEPLTCLGFAVAATLLALDLSGMARGETERLWLGLNPAWAAAAAGAVAARPGRFWPLTVQPLQLGLMALALPPMVRPF